MLTVLLLRRLSMIIKKRKKRNDFLMNEIDQSTAKDCCRTCLSTRDLTALFSDKENAQKRSEELKLLTGLDIKIEDQLSQQICRECLQAINSALSFRKTCRKAEKRLLSINLENPISKDSGNTKEPQFYIQTEHEMGKECLKKEKKLSVKPKLRFRKKMGLNSKKRLNLDDVLQKLGMNDEFSGDDEDTDTCMLKRKFNWTSKLKDAQRWAESGIYLDEPTSMSDDNQATNEPTIPSGDSTLKIDEHQEFQFNLEPDTKKETKIKDDCDVTDVLESSTTKLNLDDVLKKLKMDEEDQERSIGSDCNEISNIFDVQLDKIPVEPRRRRVRIKTPEGGELKCPTCGNLFKTKGTLKTHMKFHNSEGFVVCELCGKCCKSMILLNGHKRVHHGLTRIHKCKYCDYSPANKEALVVHERLHTGETPFICHHCGAAFHRRSNMVQHLAIHEPVKNYECKVCHKREASKKRLYQHVYLRHRVKHYRLQCPVCPGTFSNLKNVRKHLLRIHHIARADQGRIERVAN